MNKFLCSILGHSFALKKGELGILKVNTCSRCKYEVRYEVQLVEEGIKVPDYGRK